MRFCLLFVLFFCSLCRAQERTQTLRDIEYGRAGTRILHLDLVRPAKFSGKLPLVLYFHGGGWERGDYRKIPPVGFALAKSGIAFASLQFRLSTEAVFPAPLEDARQAVRFFKTRGQNYSVDAQKMGALGVSTGGQIAALLAFTGSTVRALATQGAPTDLLGLNENSRVDWMNGDSVLARYLGGAPDEKRELARRASPLLFADETAPPTLLLHGADDDFIAPSQSDKLYNALKKSGVEVTFLLFENENHAFKDAREKADAEIVKFFRAHLR